VTKASASGAMKTREKINFSGLEEGACEIVSKKTKNIDKEITFSTENLHVKNRP
jgi:hypothetical protein